MHHCTHLFRQQQYLLGRLRSCRDRLKEADESASEGLEGAYLSSATPRRNCAACTRLTTAQLQSMPCCPETNLAAVLAKTGLETSIRR